MSFFFVLSGFVLALNYQEKLLTKRISKYTFFIRRVIRLYPLHLLTLICSLPIVWYKFSLAPTNFIFKGVLNASLLQSWVPLRGVYQSFNGPSWSISDEMFFYIVFPLLIMLITRGLKSGFKWVLIFGVLSVVPILMWANPVGNDHWFFYINPAMRLVDFMIGILLFNLYDYMKKHFKQMQKVHFTLMELMALMLMVLFFSLHTLIPQVFRYSVYYWIPVSALILIFAFERGLISNWLSDRRLVIFRRGKFCFLYDSSDSNQLF